MDFQENPFLPPFKSHFLICLGSMSKQIKVLSIDCIFIRKPFRNKRDLTNKNFPFIAQYSIPYGRIDNSVIKVGKIQLLNTQKLG